MNIASLFQVRVAHTFCIQLMQIAEYGLCACQDGMNGNFCKHQAFIHKEYSIQFPNAPAVSTEDRHFLATVALGDDCPPVTFFTGFTEFSANCPQPTSESQDIERCNDDNCIAASSTSNTANEACESNHDATGGEAAIAELKAEISRIGSLLSNSSTTVAAVRAVLPCLKLIGNEQQAVHVLHQCRSVLRAYRGEHIRVQPTAIARRQTGATRGSKRIASGRPSGSQRRHQRC